ncbi:MAG: trigger factor [Muricomes sp.]
MKKKILAATLSVLMVASLAGCSKQLSNDYVTIKQYEGLEVQQVEKVEVTDDQVESTINSNLSAAAVSEDVKDRAAQNGDIVNLDFVGSVDGVEFEGGSAKDTDLELGSGSFIGANGDYKGFEEQIIGHNIGENFDITVQFPEQYQNADMAGKVAVFNVTLNGIKVSNVPELKDEWVKENSKTSKTVKEYKAEIKKTLEESAKKNTDYQLQSEVMEALVDQIEVKKYPDGEVDKQLKVIKDYYSGMAESYGMEFKDFLEQYMGMKEEDFNTQAKEAAEMAVKRNVACELIAKKKNLELSDKEYKKQVKELAESSGYDDVDAFTKQVGEDVLKTSILQQEVAKYLVDKCVQVEKAATTDDSKTQTQDSGTKTKDSESKTEDSGSKTETK